MAKKKKPTAEAGEYVREEFHRVREGKDRSASPQQTVAIGLAKARKAGVPLPPPPAKRKRARGESASRDRAGR